MKWDDVFVVFSIFQTQDVDTMVLANSGPLSIQLAQHWANVSCLMGGAPRSIMQRKDKH